LPMDRVTFCAFFFKSSATLSTFSRTSSDVMLSTNSKPIFLLLVEGNA
jgi:hypothetical protein